MHIRTYVKMRAYSVSYTNLDVYKRQVYQFIMKGNIQDDIRLQEGDVVIVPALSLIHIQMCIRDRGTTRAEGGDEGNAIQNINSLCMLFYDTTGKLVHNYIVKDVYKRQMIRWYLLKPNEPIYWSTTH